MSLERGSVEDARILSIDQVLATATLDRLPRHATKLSTIRVSSGARRVPFTAKGFVEEV